jgi:hypothetical protein
VKIYKVSSEIIAYHGSREPFESFDINRAIQGILWFSQDYESIANQESGANSARYIATVKLYVNNYAGWEEYDKYYLQQIQDMGFDSIKLDDNWIVFDPDRAKILKLKKNQKTN